MPNANATKSQRESFFYIFGVSGKQFVDSEKDLLSKVTAGCALRYAFDTLADQFLNAHLDFKPSDDLRRALSVESLPAFAMSDKDLAKGASLPSKAPRLPSVLNVFRFKKRKQILESQTYVPTVEAEILSLFTTRDSMFQFVQDLHVANVDGDLRKATHKIQAKVIQVAGTKVANTLRTVRTVVHG
jgi:hypothetical protein